MKLPTKIRTPALLFTLIAVMGCLVSCGGGSEPTLAKHQISANTAAQAQAPNFSDFNAPGPQFPTSLEDLLPTPSLTAWAAPKVLGSQNEGYAMDTGNRQAVQLFYRTVFSSSEGIASGWNGDAAKCDAGDTSREYKDATLRRVNWFRAMAGVPAKIQWDATFNANAQQAAMLMSANKSLSHYPPASWVCYNNMAATGAGKSNLTLGLSGPAAINEYMRDPGSSNSPVGHRRWILYPQTQRMGTGDTTSLNGLSASNALWVMDANSFEPRPKVRDDFVAWPAKGYVPYTVVYPRWSFAYPAADFSSSVVSMTENGDPITTRQESVSNGYGENTLVWMPGNYVDGTNWARPTRDTTYQVTVSNVMLSGQPRSFTYAVTVFDPDQEGTGNTPNSISGSNTANAGSAASYNFAAVPGATEYQWRSLQASTFSLNDGAEAGLVNFRSFASSGYSIISTDTTASGDRSFHFAHTNYEDQILLLESSLVGNANSKLTFRSRLGLSTPTQVARVDVSTDEGKNWVSVFQQAGDSLPGFGESTFSLKTVSLANYVDKTLLLRFRYDVGSASYYPQASSGVGWYVDDINLQGFDAIASVTEPSHLTGTGFVNLTPNCVSTVLLQMRPGMFGYYSEWSSIKRVAILDSSVIHGTEGDDILTGCGRKTINGGNGLDTLVYSGIRATYTLTKTINGYTVSGTQGTDVLTGIERLRFSDRTVALDIDGNAGKVYRTYQAAFNRVPDNSGLKYWIVAMDSGRSLDDIAGGFVSSEEFRAVYGWNPTNAQFVAKLYDNVLHRPYEQGGFDFWTNLLTRGVLTRAQVLAAFAESAENKAGVLNAIVDGIDLLN